MTEEETPGGEPPSNPLHELLNQIVTQQHALQRHQLQMARVQMWQSWLMVALALVLVLVTLRQAWSIP